MKKHIMILCFLILGIKASAQSDLYLIFDKTTPVVTKNLYKNVRNNINNPRMQECGMSKINEYYIYRYSWYYGIDLELVANSMATAQMMTQTQALALYPQARTAAQFDLQMQPHIDYDYITPLPNRIRRDVFTSATITYIRSFTRIFVIEFLPNNQAKVIECVITSMH